ncbi:hypothetical protein CYMTET_10211 [Cymbomonas tetramitiformis]|uniref:Uncharacterized protein n=1 Tax=Cymbomonas tetramitiformis TaxID=36881 RepID=A0AAE0LEP7_9CHLO|nr:hypothetical protein CYMTET_10211 [Cymbomonas tetramitiformis]
MGLRGLLDQPTPQYNYECIACNGVGAMAATSGTIDAKPHRAPAKEQPRVTLQAQEDSMLVREEGTFMPKAQLHNLGGKFVSSAPRGTLCP